MSKLNPKVTAYGPWIVGVRAKNNSARKPVGGDGEASTRAMRSFRKNMARYNYGSRKPDEIHKQA